MLEELETKNPQIIQQNRILMGGQAINLRSRQMAYALAANMDIKDPEGIIEIQGYQFLEWVNSKTENKWSNIYALVKEILKDLNDNPILIKKEKGKGFIAINWLSSLGVENGKIRARFSKDIAHYLLYKQGLPYTKLLWDLRDYKSSYTARIMDLFQNNHIKESGKKEVSFEMKIDELKFFFGVHKKYKRFFDFEKKVLKFAKNELEQNDFAPYWFEYKKIRVGRSIGKIKFTVYIRPKVLLELIPNLKTYNKGQPSLFDDENLVLSNTGKAILHDLKGLKIKEDKALRIMYNLSYSQAKGYCKLVEYGINIDLAFTLVKDCCSFNQIANYEDRYIGFVLDKIEKARIQRIVESRKTGSKKKTTPDDKRGGLVKKPLQEQRYFPEFMDRFSTIRNDFDEVPEPLFIKG